MPKHIIYPRTCEDLQTPYERTVRVDVIRSQGWKYEGLLRANPGRSDGVLNSFAMLLATKGRVFFISEAGCIGLAPQEAWEGDRIAVLLGSEVPFMLRPRDEGRYLLVMNATCIA